MAAGTPLAMGRLMRFGELRARLGVPARWLQYALDTNPPPGVADHPGQGFHRDFDLGQCYWLALLLTLKGNSLSLAKAAACTRFARKGFEVLKDFTQRDEFRPFEGKFIAEYQWFLEVADGQHARIVSDAEPDEAELDDQSLIHVGPILHNYPWIPLAQNCRLAGKIKDIQPLVLLRVDLVALAGLLTAPLVDRRGHADHP